MWTPPPTQAIEMANWAMTRALNNGERRAELSDAQLNQIVATAHALLDQERYEEAAERFDVVSRARGAWYSYRAAYAEAIWRGRGDFQEASLQIARCLELRPLSLDCHTIRGLMALDLGDAATAIDEFQALLSARSSDVDVRERLGRILLDADYVDEALDALRPAVEIEPERLSLVLLFARALETANAIDEARAAYEAVRDTHRDPIRGATYLLRFLERQGFTSEAARLHRTIAREIEGRIPDRNLRPL